uniref:Uncharacterized protein n=1 Tax=Oryza meridionalis TaxID=40149 RepID=A0A0E0DHZ2_9ORYZ
MPWRNGGDESAGAAGAVRQYGNGKQLARVELPSPPGASPPAFPPPPPESFAPPPNSCNQDCLGTRQPTG